MPGGSVCGLPVRIVKGTEVPHASSSHDQPDDDLKEIAAMASDLSGCKVILDAPITAPFKINTISREILISGKVPGGRFAEALIRAMWLHLCGPFTAAQPGAPATAADVLSLRYRGKA